ncbi:DUF202 domain-containing protein [Alteromonas aestuariivivens]|uniref:DUF202 domain-containing protein n=1 Tax=Alteromonas aestuariivivens TaxID=1938339 RepID=A0A3D8M7H8_9ALTE|nr:DUF202 domain-containing protein [Alteromonas aestuariivivens]RDV25549.1 DUF202 domain-containing protein [Alteromonas aestuariivivens]
MSDAKDPRVLFAAERTLLAWNRTSIALIAFGFVVERSGLLMAVLVPNAPTGLPYWLIFSVGMGFIILGTFTALYSSRQFAKVLANLKPADFPDGYATKWSIAINLLVALMGAVIALALALAH